MALTTGGVPYRQGVLVDVQPVRVFTFPFFKALWRERIVHRERGDVYSGYELRETVTYQMHSDWVSKKEADRLFAKLKS